jgi:hypothetical protein
MTYLELYAELDLDMTKVTTSLWALGCSQSASKL